MRRGVWRAKKSPGARELRDEGQVKRGHGDQMGLTEPRVVSVSVVPTDWEDLREFLSRDMYTATAS